MKYLLLVAFLSLASVSNSFADLPANYQLETDWHLDPSSFVAAVQQDEASNQITLSNGLIRRTFRTSPNGATIAFDNLMTGQSMLRSVRPEGSITVDGTKLAIGGLVGQPNHAFLTTQWLEGLTTAPDAMKYTGMEIGHPAKRMEWKRVRPHAPDAQWPPKGVYLRMDYEGVVGNDAGTKQLKVSVHYEMYDGIPAMTKWITVQNNSEQTVSVDRFCAEILAVVEQENQVELRDGVDPLAPDVMHVETDMAFGGFNHRNANRHTVKWSPDPDYSTQVNYLRQQPCLLTVAPTFGPAQDVKPGEQFESFRVFELVYDSSDRERRGLALRKMYRTLAPWVTENPLMLHCKSSQENVVRNAIDQAAATGFEMVILSFGSGFDSENDKPEYLAAWKKMNDYAMGKGIHLGSYSLYSSRNMGKQNSIVPPQGMTNAHGVCPAITSEWGQVYLAKLYNLFEKTGFLVFENDGPYPGDVDTTARPPLQKGVDDSRWVHWRTWTDFYKHLRGRGVYMNLPDYYYLSGSNKCGMGYREVNWSLPREQQRIHTRQNIFDGTWTKTPSMGWMFVPLVQYHGGGAEATIEPLDQHCDHYEIMMRSNLGLGVQACYRGPRLYDTDKTREMVTDVVAWYKQHRSILESDLIHGRRADGRDLDWMLHVNPNLEERALLSVYNPTDHAISKSIRVPLYYAGLTERAAVFENELAAQDVSLDRYSRALIQVQVPANGYSCFVFRYTKPRREE